MLVQNHFYYTDFPLTLNNFDRFLRALTCEEPLTTIMW